MAIGGLDRLGKPCNNGRLVVLLAHILALTACHSGMEPKSPPTYLHRVLFSLDYFYTTSNLGTIHILVLNGFIGFLISSTLPGEHLSSLLISSSPVFGQNTSQHGRPKW